MPPIDAIIVDSTDPIGVGEVLFTDEFYRNCARVLAAGGLIVNQCGVPFMQADELRETSARRARFFPHVGAYVAAVPTYVGGFMTLGFAAKRAGLGAVPVETIRARAEAAGILGTTQVPGRRRFTPPLSRCRPTSRGFCRSDGRKARAPPWTRSRHSLENPFASEWVSKGRALWRVRAEPGLPLLVGQYGRARSRRCERTVAAAVVDRDRIIHALRRLSHDALGG